MLEGKFRCVQSADSTVFKVGKIYEFKNGVTIKENERESCRYEDLEDFDAFNRKIYKMEPFLEDNKTNILLPKETLWDKFCKVGNVVETRNGDMHFILPNKLISRIGWMMETTFDKDTLLDIYDNNKDESKFDIMKVYEAPIKGYRSWSFGPLDIKNQNADLLIKIWDREEHEAELEKESKRTEIQAQIEALQQQLDELG